MSHQAVIDQVVPSRTASASSAGEQVADRDWWRSAVIYEVYVAQLRGRQRRRHRRPGRCAVAAALPPGPRCRRHLVHALVRLAAGGRRLRRRRLPRDRSDVRDAGRSRAADRGGVELGIRTIVDIVPNHVSDQHPWFQAALAAGPGSPERARFWFRPGRGPNGDEMPTEWRSNFSGPAWTRTHNPDGSPGEWYLHLFSAEQPDLNWDHPDVRREHEEILAFWFDRGVAGVRIDSAALLVKDPSLPEIPADPRPGSTRTRTATSSTTSTAAGGRSRTPTRARASSSARSGCRTSTASRSTSARTSCTRPSTSTSCAAPWDAASLRASIDATLAAHAPVGAPATWVLSNHDVTRPVTRYGREDTSFSFAAKRQGSPDTTLGRRRARAAALLAAALPGSLYIYQGDELGLDEVQDLPPHQLRDPMYFRSGGTDPGRDGCRVPLPWSGDAPPFGFSPAGGVGAVAAATGPLVGTHRRRAAEATRAPPSTSTASALRIRHEEAGLGDGPMRWLPSPDGVLAFARGSGFISITNLSGSPFALPEGAVVLLASEDVPSGHLPPDATAWLRLERPSGESAPVAEEERK